MTQLPSKLGKEPLIDVVFEMRFQSSLPASNLLPGLLVQQLAGAGNIRMERQPAADIPEQLRTADPALTYLPLISLFWDQFVIGISDRSVTVSCAMPYPGWIAFKGAIMKVIESIADAPYIARVERHSLKYVDLLEIADISKQIAAVNLKCSLGGHELSKETFHMRMDVPEGNYIKILNIASNAEVVQNDQRKKGVVVDVDIILPLNVAIHQYGGDCDAMLDEIHTINKATFFSCLRSETVESLEPVYEY